MNEPSNGTPRVDRLAAVSLPSRTGLPFLPAETATTAPQYTSVEADDGDSLFQIVARHWIWILCSTLIASGIGLYVAWNYSSITWTFTTTLLYNETSFDLPEYRAPNVKTWASLMRTPEILTALHEEFPNGEPLKKLAERIETSVPWDVTSFDVSITGKDREQTARKLQRLVDLFQQRVRGIHHAGLERVTADTEAALLRGTENIRLTKAELADFYRNRNVADLELEAQRLQTQLVRIELEHETARRNQQAYQTQLNKLEAILEQRAQQASLRNDQNGVKQLSAARARIDLEKRNILKDRIQSEKTRLDQKTAFVLKKAEYERAQALHARQLISDAEFERTEAEYKGILQLSQNDDLQRWNRQLEQINARLPELYRQTLMQGDQSSMRLADLAAELELKAVSSIGETDMIARLIARKQDELDRYTTIKREAEPLRQAVEAASLERRKLEGRLAMLERLQQTDSEMFTIVDPVSLAVEGKKSNFLKLLLAGTGAAGLLLVSPLFVVELLRMRQRPVTAAANRLRIPALAEHTDHRWKRINPLDWSLYSDDLRLLALRLQQSLAESSGVILFSSLTGRTLALPRLAKLAHCLALRGERVALIDLRGPDDWKAFAQLLEPVESMVSRAEEDISGNGTQHPNGSGGDGAALALADVSQLAPPGRLPRWRSLQKPAGITDLLGDSRCDINDVLRPSIIPRVDCLPWGTRLLPPEGIASQRLTDLLDELRQRYDRLLVFGPGTDEPVELQMLAARADGIVFSLEGTRLLPSRQRDIIRDLRETHAPVLGVIG